MAHLTSCNDIFQYFSGEAGLHESAIIFWGSEAAAQDRQSIWFRTYGHPDFKFYYDLFSPALRATRDDSFYPFFAASLPGARGA